MAGSQILGKRCACEVKFMSFCRAIIITGLLKFECCLRQKCEDQGVIFEPKSYEGSVTILPGKTWSS